MAILPIRMASDVGEFEEIKVFRLSPDDTSLLMPNAKAKDKLKGIDYAHFSGFLKKKYRQNDYLWGRLDTAERMLDLIFKNLLIEPNDLGDFEKIKRQNSGYEKYKDLPGFYKRAFAAILEEEKDLGNDAEFAETFKEFQNRVAAL